MYESVYIVVVALCVVILGYILYRSGVDIDQRAENIAFKRLVASVILIQVMDAGSILARLNSSGAMYVLGVVSGASYLFMTAVAGFFFYCFTELQMNPKKRIDKRTSFWLVVPLVAQLALCVSSIWTKQIFYVDAANVYHRGPYHVIVIIIAFGYVVVAAANVLSRLSREHSKYKRSELLTLLSFFILPGIGIVLEAIFAGVPTTWAGATCSLLMVYCNFQSYRISTDGLTGLNNRLHFDKYLHTTAFDTRRTDRLFLLLMDIDGFKHINDTFGHLEGDHALTHAARQLQYVCRRRNAFLARYGGDEFAIVYLCDGRDDVEHLRADINKAFDDYNRICKKAYNITMSIGYEEFSPEAATTVRELVELADEALYKEKSAKQAVANK